MSHSDLFTSRTLALCFSLLLACHGGTKSSPDADGDSGRDGVAEAPDADAATQPSPDAREDGANDVPADGGKDAAGDVRGDAASDPSADVASDGARDLVADMARDASAGDGARDTTADVASEAGRDGAPDLPADLPLDGIGVGPIQTAPTPAGACSPACTAPETCGGGGMAGKCGAQAEAPGRLCSTDGWCWQNPLPQGNVLEALWVRTPTDVWAVGWGGTVLRFDGTTWQLVPSGTTEYLHGVWGSSASDVWVVGSNGLIRHFDGSAWATFDSGTTNWLQAIWGTGANDVWIAGWYETTLHWDGSTWTSVPGPGAKPLELLYGVWGSATDDVWVTGGHGHLQHWDGTAWSMVNLGLPNDELHGVTGTGPDDVWIASYDRILHWNGSAWSTSWTSTNGATGPLTKFFGVGASSPSEAWAVGRAETNDSSGPSLFRWDGTRWSPVMDGPQATLYAVAALGAGKALAVGDITELVGTGTPVRIGSGSPGALHSVWGSSTSDVWAVGGYWLYPNSNRLHHWDGQRWTAAPSATARWGANAVWGSGPADVWAGGEGAVEHWDGQAWSAWSFPAGGAVLGLWGSAAGDVWASGTDSSLFHWDGTRWSVAQSTFANYADFEDVWGTARDDVWIVGGNDGATSIDDQTNVALHFDGAGWSLHSPGGAHRLHAVHGTAPDDVWAVGHGGFVVHWDGAAWKEVPVGTTNQLFAVRARSRTDVWVVGDYGLVLHWNGTTWATSPALAGDPIYDLWSPGGATGDVFAVGNGMILRRNGP